MNARALLLLALVLTACADEQPPARIVTVKAADFGDAWPLLATQAQIGCDPPSVVYVEVGGKRYGLNGKALSAGFPRGDEIAKGGNGAALSILIDPALATCQGKR